MEIGAEDEVPVESEDPQQEPASGLKPEKAVGAPSPTTQETLPVTEDPEETKRPATAVVEGEEPTPTLQPMDAQQLEERLRKELSRGMVDVEKIRVLCRVQNVPDALRADVWKVMFGVEKQTANPLASWDGTLDLPNQDELSQDCEGTRATEDEFRIEERRASLEQLLTFYCKRRSVSYIRGVVELMAPLFHVNLSGGAVFNCFYALVQKHIPRLFCGDPHTLENTYLLFRLVLLYHDPELCRHIDQYGVHPSHYAGPWLMTLLAKPLPIRLVLLLWDMYFVSGDAILNVFVSVALVIHHRETIFRAGKANLRNVLTSLRVEDEKDLWGLTTIAKLLDANTPRTLRLMLRSASIYSSETPKVTLHEHIASLFCLTVSVAELQRTRPKGYLLHGAVRYVVLDCRSEQEFQCGRLPTAVRLEPDLVNNPEELLKTMSEFEKMKGQHFCFSGRGVPTEDTHVPILVLQFLQKGFKHVSMAEEGYLACHRLFEEGTLELVDHEITGCHICLKRHGKHAAKLLKKKKERERAASQPNPRTTPTGKGTLKSFFKEKFHKFAEPRERAGSVPPLAFPDPPRNHIAENSSDVPIVAHGEETLSVEPRISDETPEPIVAAPEDDTLIDKDCLVNMNEWAQNDSIQCYECHKVKKDGETRVRRNIVVTLQHVITVEPLPESESLVYAKLKSKFHISHIARISFKKKNRHMVTFKFVPIPGEPPILQTFVMEDPQGCVQAIKANLAKLNVQTE